MEALNWACKNGDLDALQNKDSQVLVKENVNKLLLSSCDYGQVEIVKYLITQGADVNAENQFGITPLLTAIYEGHTGCVKVLLEHGANKNGKTPSGECYIKVAPNDDIKMLLK